MANLKNMPAIVLSAARLVQIGKHWNAKDSELPKTQGELVGKLCDEMVGNALATMLGGIEVKKPKMNSLLPAGPDCVEVGPTRVIGGIRPQNFDVAYRPDGVRFAYDSKTLNGQESLAKNYQNMINDLGAEATTVIDFRISNATLRSKKKATQIGLGILAAGPGIAPADRVLRSTRPSTRLWCPAVHWPADA
jgi:hypothetical protein